MSIIAHTVGYADGENGQVFPITDRRIYGEIASGKSGIVKGCELTYVSNNTVHISSGWGVISGCIFTVEDEDISVQLAPSGELAGWLYARISSNASSAEFVSDVGVEFDPADLMNDDLTVTDGVHDLILATYTVSTTGLSDFADVAPKINLGADLTGIVGGDAWTQRTYTAGEFCIYNNKAWECVADTTNVPSESDTAHWKVVSLKTISGDLSKKIYVLITSFNTQITTNKVGTIERIGTIQIPEGFTSSNFAGYSIDQFGSMDANVIDVNINSNDMSVYVYYEKVGYNNAGIWVKTLWMK